MQQEKVQITNEDISYSEKILLKQGESFDRERKDFIRNLDTIDLQAVPGSGKTTALLAKLLILEKYLPFDNGSGILVISHTNAAIDEIKQKIGKKCSKIFSYPNFVGTIQSFVDEFLAIPCGHNCLKTRLSWINSERFQKRLWDKFLKIYWSEEFEKPGTWFWSRHIEKARNIAKKEGGTEKDICNTFIEKEVKDLFFDFTELKIKTITNNKTLLADQANKKYIGIKKIIFEILDEGVISFEYAYYLAIYYCQKFPKLKKLLQKRFRYVFVDEMQDMDTHQYKILEDIFYDDGDSLSKYQRIGDKNQAIFSGDVKIDDIWKKRKIELPLKGSYRLSPNIAYVVRYFGLEFLEIDGRNNKTNIKPHLIVFEEPKDVLKEFTKIIKKNNLDQIPTDADEKYPFRAVGWVGKQNERGLTIIDYHMDFDRDERKTKIDYPNLKSCLLFYDKEKKILEPIRNNILNAFLRILRFENKKDENDRNYTKRKFLNFLKEKFPKKYEKFKSKLFDWSYGVIKGNIEDVFFEMKYYIPNFLNEIFGINYLNQETNDFVSNTSQGSESENSKNSSGEQDSNRKNIYQNEENGIEVKVGTVHSVKGKTHIATLYLETYYYKDGRGENSKSYESQRLGEQFKGSRIKGNEGDRVKQSAKMVYVGFSRPTHLLCFAVHKKRFKRDMISSNWEVCEIF